MLDLIDRAIRWTCYVVAVMALLLALTGCNANQIDQYRQTLESIEQRSEQIEPYVAELASVTYDAREYIETLPEDSELRRKLEPLIVKSSDTLDEAMGYFVHLDDAAREARERIERMEAGASGVGNALEVAGHSGGAVATFLPPPWSAVVAGGASLLTLLAGFFGANERRKRQEESGHINQIVRAIEAVKGATGGTVDFNSDSTRKALKASMGATTDRRIDDARASS